MHTQSDFRRVALSGAWVTALYLVGSLLVGLGLGLLANAVPMHVPELGKNIFASIITLSVVGIGAAAWGRAMSRKFGSGEQQRMAWAGALGFGPTVIFVGVALAVLEMMIVERAGSAISMHVLFTILFVPAVFFVVAVTGLAIGIALRDWVLGGRLAVLPGLAAAAAFLVVDVFMDLIGWRVGAPGAAERATMVTVTLLGNIGAALVGGAAMGILLSGYAAPHRAIPPSHTAPLSDH